MSEPDGTDRPGFWLAHLEPHATAVSLSVAPAEGSCNLTQRCFGSAIILHYCYNKASSGDTRILNNCCPATWTGSRCLMQQAPVKACCKMQ